MRNLIIERFKPPYLVLVVQTDGCIAVTSEQHSQKMVLEGIGSCGKNFQS